MFEETLEGKTHSYGDNCEPPHIPPEPQKSNCCQAEILATNGHSHSPCTCKASTWWHECVTCKNPCDPQLETLTLGTGGEVTQEKIQEVAKEWEINLCENCGTMTNHLGEKCLRCPQKEGWEERFETKFVVNNIRPIIRGNLEARIMRDFITEEITRAREEEREKVWEEFETWLIDNGITHKECFVKMLKFIRSHSDLITKIKR